jgi:hypothetical protein
VLEPKVHGINRILFPAMQFGRIAGVGHFALPTFICASVWTGDILDRCARTYWTHGFRVDRSRHADRRA